jgi:hypothetical protein
MKEIEQKIQSQLFEKYKTSFNVSFIENNFEIFPNNYEKLADNLKVENDSPSFWEILEQIRKEVKGCIEVRTIAPFFLITLSYAFHKSKNGMIESH